LLVRQEYYIPKLSKTKKFLKVEEEENEKATVVKNQKRRGKSR
jgi:hypothetical protein